MDMKTRSKPSSKPRIPRAPSEPEERFALTWKTLKGPAFEREYRFCERKWRFDFAWPAAKVAVEIEGGIHDHGPSRGYHLRKAGFLKDATKYNRAAVLGWRVMRLAPSQIQPGTLIELAEMIEEVLSGRQRDT